MTIRALIFDFDGLILETEAPEYDAWVEIYQEYSCDLPLTEWVKCVGADYSSFDPLQFLAEKTGLSLDLEEIHARQRARSRAIVNGLPPLPGIPELLRDARTLGLRLAVASSSSRAWVVGNLDRLALTHCFDVIITAEQVERIKPAPDLYLRALETLGVSASEAVVFEDSLNGLTAALAAGLFCMVVPTRITQGLDFRHAGLVLPSLAQHPLVELIPIIEAARSSATS